MVAVAPLLYVLCMLLHVTFDMVGLWVCGSMGCHGASRPPSPLLSILLAPSLPLLSSLSLGLSWGGDARVTKPPDGAAVVG
jgi:hypothetical protein